MSRTGATVCSLSPIRVTAGALRFFGCLASLRAYSPYPRMKGATRARLLISLRLTKKGVRGTAHCSRADLGDSVEIVAVDGLISIAHVLCAPLSEAKRIGGGNTEAGRSRLS